MSIGAASCEHCLWDIYQDPHGGWRLHVLADDDTDPWACDGSPNGHEPMEWLS